MLINRQLPSSAMASSTRTVDDVLNQLGDKARSRLIDHFTAAGVTYPPKQLTFLAIKDKAVMEVWAGPESSPSYIHSYPILALSGLSGPKLREGDRQVPEGIYSISGLNPNSRFHLSMKINYPNDFDLTHAKVEGRTTPGTNIFIHGKAASVGCLAMGDPAIEELFVLAADSGRTNIDVVIAPTDPRETPLTPVATLAWTTELYDAVSEKFAHYQR